MGSGAVAGISALAPRPAPIRGTVITRHELSRQSLFDQTKSQNHSQTQFNISSRETLYDERIEQLKEQSS